MSALQNPNHDYTRGVPRYHHNLYMKDGNFVMQVENAIFKIHRSVLERYSEVIKSMLDAPQSSGPGDGTDANPLVLTGDSVLGWELLLGYQYDSPLFNPDVYTGERLLLVLPIAHKYCMEEVENALITQLKRKRSTAGLVDLLEASRMIDSKPLYEETLLLLAKSRPLPDLVQARRIGLDALFAIMDGLKTCQFCPCSCNRPCTRCYHGQTF